jgi:hypothetical protein
LLLSLSDRNPSTYLELKIAGSLAKSFKKNVKIRIRFSMCRAVRFDAFLSGIGGII